MLRVGLGLAISLRRVWSSAETTTTGAMVSGAIGGASYGRGVCARLFAASSFTPETLEEPGEGTQHNRARTSLGQRKRVREWRPPPSDADLLTLASALRERPSPPAFTFLLGGPGSGKGTLSEFISARTGLAHVSVGALLRTAAQQGSAESRLISAEMSRGGVLPSEMCTRVLLRHFCQATHNEWLVDGFPRSFANAVLFNNLALRPRAVVALEVDDATMLARLRLRRRRDDVDYIIERRLVQFRSEWESIKEFYKRRNLLVKIDADGTPEQVWQRYLGAMSAFDSRPNL